MLTGELRNQIDGIWNDFWSGGLSNPLRVIEQITTQDIIDDARRASPDASRTKNVRCSI